MNIWSGGDFVQKEWEKETCLKQRKVDVIAENYYLKY